MLLSGKYSGFVYFFVLAIFFFICRLSSAALAIAVKRDWLIAPNLAKILLAGGLMGLELPLDFGLLHIGERSLLTVKIYSPYWTFIHS